MKKIYLVLIVIICSFAAKAQTEFAMTPADGFNFKVEIEVPGKSAAELYQLTKNWIYDKKEITLGKVKEGQALTFEGNKPGLFSMGGLGKTTFDGRYTVDMIFGEGKYVFYIMSVEMYNSAAGKWMDAALHKAKDFYNKKGELKSMYKYYPETVAYFNDLNLDLKTYINSGK